jgi:hypothetical protein
MQKEVDSKKVHGLRAPGNSPQLGRRMNRPGRMKDRLKVLDSEGVILTIELRNALIAEAKRLLPAAIRQARGSKGKPGSPVLLRMITRLAMQLTEANRAKRS